MIPVFLTDAMREALLKMSKDPYVFLQSFEDLFLRRLIEAGYTKADRYYEIKQIYFSLNSGETTERAVDVIHQNSTEPAQTQRELIGAMGMIDGNAIKGYFPYVEEHGTELDDPREQKLLRLITRYEDVASEVLDGFEIRGQEGRLESGFQRLYQFMTQDVARIVPVDPSEILASMHTLIQEGVYEGEVNPLLKKPSDRGQSSSDRPAGIPKIKMN